MKLDLAGRQEANAVLEQMQDDQEALAYEIVGLRRIAGLAQALISSSAWAGVSDEDVALERAIKDWSE